MGVSMENKFIHQRYARIKILLKLVGLMGGLFGLLLVVSAMLYLIQGSVPGYLMFSISIVSGAYFIYVAYIILRRFSSTAIKHVCAVMSIGIAMYLPKIMIAIQRVQTARDMEVLFRLVSLIIALLFYALSSKLLIKWFSTKET